MKSCGVNNFSIRPLPRSKNRMTPAILRVSVLCLAVLIFAALPMDLITNSQGLAAYSLLLLGYLYLETRNLKMRDKQLFWINPVVLASIFTFVMAFGVTNILYFFPEDIVALVGMEPIATPWMNQLMLLVVMGAISMWIGYSSGMGRSMGKMLRRSRVLSKWMTHSWRINRPAFYACLLISLLAKLWAIKLGIYGYSSSNEQLIAAANYTQYFAMADSLGKLALVGLALQCFAGSRSSLLDRQLLWLVLGYEVAFGFLSGMKSAVVMPFIVVGFVYYSQQNRFPRWLLPTVVVGLMAAYAVIEPFRDARHMNKDFEGTSLSSIASTMTNASSFKTDYGREQDSTVLKIFARSNLTYIGSLGIEYAANHSRLPAGSPAFLSDIVLAPAHALIPRFLWAGKSMQNIGLWYTQEVIGYYYSISSTGMSPFTYLNFAGGPTAVVLGFLLVGIVQRGLFDGLRYFGVGGLFVHFGLLGPLINIDSAFNSFFINLFRFLPILVVVQYVLLRRSRR